MIAAFFAGENDKKRKEKLEGLADVLAGYLANPLQLSLRNPRLARRGLGWGTSRSRRFTGRSSFRRSSDGNPGFDAFVGNPPFMGGWTISASLGQSYLDWVMFLNPGTHGVCNFVAHFFRRAFSLLRAEGCLG